METLDDIIVGSGFGGAIPALRLARTGRSILCLEQGERLTEKDFVQDWGFKAQSRLFVTYTSKDYPVLLGDGRGIGGGSLTYAAAMLRSPSEVFTWRDRVARSDSPDRRRPILSSRWIATVMASPAFLPTYSRRCKKASTCWRHGWSWPHRGLTAHRPWRHKRCWSPKVEKSLFLVLRDAVHGNIPWCAS